LQSVIRHSVRRRLSHHMRPWDEPLAVSKRGGPVPRVPYRAWVREHRVQKEYAARP
jgi:hypothetical protein